MGSLSGLGVLVTRPEHQAGPLCRLVEAEGGTALRYPALVIRGCADRAAVGAMDDYDLVVFVSANAVHFGAALLGPPRALRLAAIGPATAAALNAAGHRVALLPRDRADSEALLALPELAQLHGQRVLIVRGTGGRELLAEELTRRGASVHYADVYTRAPARPTPELQATIRERWQRGDIHVYTATSVALLEALLGILPPPCREWLDATALLTGASRVVEAAHRRGLRSPVILAAGMDDAALVAALRCRCCGSVVAPPGT